MRKLMCFVIVVLYAAIVQAEDIPAEGKFRIYFMEKEAGEETFSFTTRGDGTAVLRASVSMSITHPMTRKENIFRMTSVLTLDAVALTPLEYTLDAVVEGGTEEMAEYNMTIKFRDQTANANFTMDGIPQEKDIKLHPGFFVLDNNFFSHYLIFVRRYLGTEDPREKFFAFVPQILQEIPFTVDNKGEEITEINGKSFSAKRIFINFGMVSVNMWLDDMGLVPKINVPVQGIRVLLDGYSGASVQSVVSPPINLVPEGVMSIDVKFPGSGIMLAGTLTRPIWGEKQPGVVLISGSGPQDRDENTVGMDLNWYIFRDLAHALSKCGYVVLRYDDRGVGQSEGDFQKAKLSDFVSDVRSALDFLAGRDDVDAERLALIGHSEGGIIAPIVACEDRRIVAIVLMAGTAKPLDEILRQQSRWFVEESRLDEEEAANILHRQEEFIRKVKESDTDTIVFDGREVFIGWFREHFAHDPIDTIKKVKCAILICQGAKDVQVHPENAKLLGEALAESQHPNYTVRIFPDLDHLFMKSKGTFGEYGDESRRIDDEFVDFVCGWLQRNLPTKMQSQQETQGE